MRLSLQVRAATVLLLAAGCAPPGPTGADGTGGPRNLLLVSIDTLRADALGCYGSERGATPYLDRWSERSVLFEQAWSSSPKTAPAHMSMLTGLPPRVHGVGNLNTAGAPSLGPEPRTLAELLRARGFATAGFTSGGNVKAELGFDRGFETFDDRGERMQRKLPELRAWLEGVGDRRWFAFFHTYQVHDPYFPPPDLIERFTDPDYAGRIVARRQELRDLVDAGQDLAPRSSGHDKLVWNYWYRVDHEDPADLAYLRDLYTACVADMDRELGAFLAWMEQAGLLDGTLVVVTADHGEEFGEHEQVRHEQLWREVLHVPLLVRLPGDRAGGTRVAAPVRHEDLVPSLLELLDVPAAPTISGEALGASWASWIDGAPGEDRPRLAEHRSRRDRSLDLWSLRQGGWLLHRSRDGTTLHDLGADPDERAPVEDAAQTARLTELLQEELGRLERAAAGVTRGEGVELDDETRAELEALGYL